jgi:excisionase family DNA binding protein
MAQQSRQNIQHILKAKRTSEANRPHLGDHGHPLLSVPEAAQLLGIKTWTMRQRLSQRRIVYVKVGRLTKLRREDITAFVERNRREAISHERQGQHEAA